MIVDNRPAPAATSAPRSSSAPARRQHAAVQPAPAPSPSTSNLYKKLPFDPIEVGARHRAGARCPTSSLVVQPELPVKTWRRSSSPTPRPIPARSSYASQGNGSTSHLTASMFAAMAGTSMVHVPYKGEGPALVDLTAARSTSSSATSRAALRFHQSGQARILAVAGQQRAARSLPDVPTFAESAARDLMAVTWFAVVAPPGTPAAIVQKLNADLRRRAHARPRCASRFLEQGAEPRGGTTAATARLHQGRGSALERRHQVGQRHARVTGGSHGHPTRRRPQRARPIGIWPETLARVPYWVYQDDAQLPARAAAHLRGRRPGTSSASRPKSPTRGDYRTTFVGEMPVIVVRDADGEIYASRTAARIAAR